MTEVTTTKQRLSGTVVSDKMRQTVVVEVRSRRRHPKYHKSYTVFKKYKAHNPNNEYHTGDMVEIESIRPMSKEKKFIVIKKV